MNVAASVKKLFGKLTGTPVETAKPETAKLSPLMHAIHDNNITAVKTALEAGANANEISSLGTPVLAYVVYWKPELEIIKLLLEAGANANATQRDGKPILLLAIEREENSLEAAQILLAAGANPSAKDDNGTPVLIHATKRGDAKMVSLLLAAGADKDAVTQNNWTAVMYTAKLEKVDHLLPIFINAGVNLEIQNRDGNTVAMLAVEHGWEEGLIQLVKAGASISTRNYDDLNVIDMVNTDWTFDQRHEKSEFTRFLENLSQHAKNKTSTPVLKAA